MLSKTLIGNGFGCWKTIVTRRRSEVGSIALMSTSSSGIRPRQRRRAGQLGEPVERAQQRRLAAARGADQRQHLALADRQRDRFDRLFVAVGDRDVVDLHPPDRELRRADRALRARRSRLARGGRRRCRCGRGGGDLAGRGGSSSGRRRTGGGCQELHVPTFRARRWTTSTAALRTRTISSRTKAAA